jgi:prepilin-type processing-associated H-X9-DG protein
LVELLVVVAIIAILAAMLLPALQGAKNRARSAECMSNLRQLSMAFHLYAENNNGFPPPHYDANATPVQWPGRIAPYLNLKVVYVWYVTEMQPVLRCGLNPLKDLGGNPSNYSVNHAICSNGPWWQWQRLGNLRNPTRTLLLFDAGPAADLITKPAYYVPDIAGDIARAQQANWHMGKLNAVYVDGHVETILTNQINSAALNPLNQ